MLIVYNGTQQDNLCFLIYDLWFGDYELVWTTGVHAYAQDTD